VVVACLPLYQSTELLRGIALEQPGPGLLWAALYLFALGTIGMWISQRRLGTLLVH
jgi:lipooligosaccharide transport system permease protein